MNDVIEYNHRLSRAHLTNLISGSTQNSKFCNKQMIHYNGRSNVKQLLTQMNFMFISLFTDQKKKQKLPYKNCVLLKMRLSEFRTKLQSFFLYKAKLLFREIRRTKSYNLTTYILQANYIFLILENVLHSITKKIWQN